MAQAEKYLNMAITLAPDDKEANRFLADCYTRQDKFSLAAPRWRAAGEETYATWFAAIQGEPYQIHGDIGRVPWHQMDPLPLLEASLNGGPPKSFSFYTRVDSLGVSKNAAREAGLHAVAEEKIEYQGKPMWLYCGVLDSFKLGGIELRNIPDHRRLRGPVADPAPQNPRNGQAGTRRRRAGGRPAAAAAAGP